MNPFSIWKRELTQKLARALEPQGIRVAEEFAPAAHQPWARERRVAVGIAGMELPGAAPVPPSLPEMRTTWAPAFATPAATVPTPASLTSFTEILASRLAFFRSKISWARSSME